MIVYLRTRTQFLLFTEEIQGQLSDGYWENEDTDRRLWDCEVFMSPLFPEVIGNPKFPVDFTDLLDAGITERMLEICRKVKPDYNVTDLTNDLQEITKTIYGKV